MTGATATHDGTTRRGSAKGKPPEIDLGGLAEPAARTSASELEALPVEDRKAIYDAVGKGAARDIGSDLVARMLTETKLSQREIDAQTGYHHSALSRMARGRSESGPTLWKLFALAEALGFRLELKLKPK